MQEIEREERNISTAQQKPPQQLEQTRLLYRK